MPNRPGPMPAVPVPRAVSRTRRRVRSLAPADAAPWYRIRNVSADKATVWLHDSIGYFGVTSADFVRDLDALRGQRLDVHINSPGGEVDDAVAIYNALRAHPKSVTVYVDGLAASAASFIMQAGDWRVMTRNGQVMIHDALGLALGNEAELRAYADVLNRYSDNIADIYAQRAGGTVAQWRKRMRAETWYTGAEVVEAGLADEVAEPDRTGVDDDLHAYLGSEFTTALEWQRLTAGLLHSKPDPQFTQLRCGLLDT